MQIKKICVYLVFAAISISAFAQSSTVTLSGVVKDKTTKEVLPFTNVVLKTVKDTAFIVGTLSNEEGRFNLSPLTPGEYFLEISYVGYTAYLQKLYVGSLSSFLDIGGIELEEKIQTVGEVEITGKKQEVGGKMDKKTFTLEDNITQTGGSVLQAMQNLPGVTVQDGKVQIRGNDKVTILVDGKQTALTGYGGQTALDNIPASAIERIEIINNPSAKYEANGNGGIINIILKKNKKEGFNGKVSLSGGLGALWKKRESLPSVPKQYQYTPKINPSLSLSYRKNKINAFLQADYLYTETLNKNEFVTRTYTDGTIIKQQTQRNRNTGFTTTKAGLDWNISDNSIVTISGLYGREKIIDNGDEPFFNNELTQRNRLWQFLEDEVKTTIMATAAYQHKFKQAGHLFNINFNYTFHREDEQYFFDNILPTYTGKDAFKLLSDEQVAELSFDYVKPLKYGQFEGGVKYRQRGIPTNMQFFPGINSPLDTNAGGKATYKEIVPAIYGTYLYETKKIEAAIGLRVEYVGVTYEVDPAHNTYKSDGYNYMQPFPNVRLAYKISDRRKVSFFYNRRVDRPNEVDIRIFPKYDDAEIIKVGNPALRPQYTSAFEIGYKMSWKKGYVYAATYYKQANGTITRISSAVPGSTLIYDIFQNAGRSENIGAELVFSEDFSKKFTLNVNLNAYQNTIEKFSVQNLYPVPNTFTAQRQRLLSGSSKVSGIFHLPKNFDAQLTAVYLAPDIIPQGKIGARFSLDMGLKKAVQKGRGELFFNATDLLNTMVIRKTFNGQGFNYTSNNYYESQVIRIGYNYKF